MSAIKTPGKDEHGRLLTLVFTIVLGAFLVSTLIVQHMSSSVDADAQEIFSSATPAIEHLAALRALTREVELALEGYIDDPTVRRARGAEFDATLKELIQRIDAYLTLPQFQGEEESWLGLRRAADAFDESARRARELSDSGNKAAAKEMFVSTVEPAAARVADAAMASIEFNAQEGRALASDIQKTHARTNILLDALMAISAVVAIGGAILLHRQTVRRRAIVEEHAKLIEARAAELEQFAGRVAHDIRNPLSAAKMASELIVRSSTDRTAKDLASRVVKGLSRANTIISGLLDFARAGAHPDPGARANLTEVIRDLFAELAHEVEARNIDLQVEPIPPVLAGCSPGVYLSLISNLIRNAIKYMAPDGPRRIVTRVIDEGAMLRTEVSDTGPGIAQADLGHLFEPYFRVERVARNGLGLGLATVKKLAESHHGEVGVDSQLGKGSTFWFTLPHAGIAGEGGMDISGEHAPPPIFH